MNTRNRGAMNMYQTNRYDMAVDYSDPQQLVYLLFSSLVDSLVDTVRHITEREWRQKSGSITRAQKILYGLKTTLDFENGGEIARNLDALYDYCLRRLSTANACNDLQAVLEVKGLMLEIKEAWTLLPARASSTSH